MAGDLPEPLESFESWLLRRVAQAVEVGEVPSDLLADLRAEFEAARDKRVEQRHADAVRDIAETLGIPLEQAAGTLATLEAQSSAIRELVMRIAEAWLEEQRRARDLMLKPPKTPDHEDKRS